MIRLESDFDIDHFSLSFEKFASCRYCTVDIEDYGTGFFLFVFRLSCIQSEIFKSPFNRQCIRYVLLSHAIKNNEVKKKGMRYIASCSPKLCHAL